MTNSETRKSDSINSIFITGICTISSRKHREALMVKCYDHAVACYKMKAFENNLVYKEIISPEYHDSVYLSVNIFFMGFFFLE